MAPYRYVLFLCALVATAGGRAAEPDRTHEFVLDNGLKLIVQEDHRAPVAVVQIWYKVGSSYEQDGATGVSHALEHMMFKRTKNLATGEFSRLVAERGGRENAFTSSDYTAYFQQWAAANVALSFRLEAERMQHLELAETEFTNELKVILEERRMRTDDNPQAQALEVAQSVAWQTSPYRQPVIGWASDIEHMQRRDLKSWYERWYAPNNAVLVVVGDVQPARILALATEHFGDVPRIAIEPPRPRLEVPQRGEKRVTVASDKARLPYLLMGYKAPGLTQVGQESGAVEEWEIYALDVLAATLDGGASARFSKELVRGQGIAIGVEASYQSSSRLEELFSFDGVPSEGHTLAELEQAIKTQIAKIQKTPPALEELTRIKTRVVAEAVYQQDSMFYQAMLIGSLEAVGLPWRLKDEYVARIAAVTPAQVQAVARKYLVDDHLTVAYLLPNGKE